MFRGRFFSTSLHFHVVAEEIKLNLIHSGGVDEIGSGFTALGKKPGNFGAAQDFAK